MAVVFKKHTEIALRLKTNGVALVGKAAEIIRTGENGDKHLTVGGQGDETQGTVFDITALFNGEIQRSSCKLLDNERKRCLVLLLGVVLFFYKLLNAAA